MIFSKLYEKHFDELFGIDEINKEQVFSYTQGINIIILVKKALCNQGKKSIILKISHDAMSKDEVNGHLIIEVLKIEDWKNSIIVPF